MKKCSLLIASLALWSVGLSAQGVKPVLVVQPFTIAKGVELPYDMKMMQSQLVAELKVEIGKQFEVVAEAPSDPQGTVYTLNGQVTGWRAGNAAKRMLVGLGSGREASDIEYQVTDTSGKKLVDKKDTIRTNFYNRMSGSTGTLTHPIAQKIAERIKDAKLK